MSLKAEIPAITIKSAIKPLVTSLLVFHTLFFFFFSFFVPETDLLFHFSKVITSDDMSSRLVSFLLLSLTLKVLFFFSNSLSLFPFLLIFLTDINYTIKEFSPQPKAKGKAYKTKESNLTILAVH